MYQDDSSGIAALFAGAWLVMILIYVAMFVFTAIVWVKIVGRTGMNKWLGLLSFVPVGNIVLLCMLAFTEWPVQSELRMANTMRGQGPALPAYTAAPLAPRPAAYGTQGANPYGPPPADGPYRPTL